jgi:ribosomal protein L10
MALTRKEKGKLVELYKELLDKAKNVVVMTQSKIPVNEINKVRMAVVENG